MAAKRQTKMEVRLTAETTVQYYTEGGQRLTATLPRGTFLTIPAAWVYQTEEVPTSDKDLVPAPDAKG